MKSICRIGLVLFLLTWLFSSALYAANDQIPKEYKITEIDAYETYANIILSNSFADTQNCGNGASTVFRIDFSVVGGEYMYSIAIAAAMANKTVGLGLSGCKDAYPKIYRVDVLF